MRCSKRRILVFLSVLIVAFFSTLKALPPPNSPASDYLTEEKEAAEQQSKSTPPGESTAKIEARSATDTAAPTEKFSEQSQPEQYSTSPVFAETSKIEPKHKFSANVSLVSDYRSRGISQAMRRPAIQGGFDYTSPCGIYIGTWASNVDGTSNFLHDTSMEWDNYIGYSDHLKIFPDLHIDAGFLIYYYPGGESRGVSFTTVEYYVAVIYKWLNVYFYQTMDNYFGIDSQNPPFNWKKLVFAKPNGDTQWSPYVETNLIIPFCKKWTLTLHGGYQGVAHYYHELAYYDWYGSITREFEWFNIFVAYVGSNANPDFYDIPDVDEPPERHSLGAQGFYTGIFKAF